MTSEECRFLESARVARMATVDGHGRPAVVPVCFALAGDLIYTPIDEKPKRRDADDLQRVRNLRANPAVALVADRWDEDWSRLGWVRVRGEAVVAPRGEAHPEAVDLLRARYPQYRAMRLEARPLIVITIASVRSWGDLSLPAG